MPTFHFIAASDIMSGELSSATGKTLDGTSITFSSTSTLQSFGYTDNETVFADDDVSGPNGQIITDGGTLGLTVGQDFEAEYTVVVQDALGNTYTLYAVSVGPSFGNVIGFAALDQFPPFGETLTVVSTSDGPLNNVLVSTYDRIASTICFSAGSMIRTPHGYRAIEGLGIGDQVITRDNGVQTIRWIAASHLTAADLAAKPSLAPVVIAANAFGPGVPARDVSVSPMHRVLLTDWRAASMFGASEVLATARALVDGSAIRQPGADVAHYHHVLFDRHEVVETEGLWTESFQPFVGVDALSAKVREEMFAIFPDLRSGVTENFGTPARPLIRDSEAAMLRN